jgi:hypothetical protein
MKYPNFLIIGAGKSGTTSVYQAIKQHPDVFMSAVKEPNFFALEGQEKTTGYDKEDPDGFNFYPWAVTNLEDYHKLFATVEKQKAIGESSTMYQYMPKAPQNIKKHIPEAKLIAIFRNPADRLYSRYLHLVRENRAPTPNFEDCFERGNLWWQKNDLVQEGFYYTHMKRYFELFDPSQIKVMLYEDLRKEPIEFMQELFDFIGVDDAFVPDMSVQYNVSGKIKNKYVDMLVGQQSLIRRGLEKISPKLIQNVRESHRMQKIVTTLRKKNLERVPLSNEVRKRLIEEIYKDEIVSFGNLIQRDLSHWLSSEKESKA